VGISLATNREPAVIFRKTFLNLVTFGILLSSLGCADEHKTLRIQGEHPLLESPYPMDYPSSAPMPNRKIRLLKNEQVVVLDERFEKDFQVYEVRTRDGLEGYLVGEPGIEQIGGPTD
jgi:hypothetical protein